MVQDAGDDTRALDQSDELDTPPAAGTCQDVEPEAPLHELRPQPVRLQPVRGGCDIRTWRRQRLSAMGRGAPAMPTAPLTPRNTTAD